MLGMQIQFRRKRKKKRLTVPGSSAGLKKRKTSSTHGHLSPRSPQGSL
jgi:hypothetical protein